MERAEILRKVQSVPYWWHHIDLGSGIVTPGHKGGEKNGTLKTLARMRLPDDLTGKTVLDIGAWDGFYSFEAERRNAARVLATDHYVWHDENIGMAGFLTAREILESKVEYLDIDVTDIAPETVGTFDITLFLGVLYHLKNPLLILEKMASVTKELIIVETQAVQTRHESVPLMQFYPGGELKGDASNWWVPNLCCLEQLVRVAGFSRVEFTHKPSYARHGALVSRINVFRRNKMRSGRAVLHGYKPA